MKERESYLGVDPGKNGALVILDGNGKLCSHFDYEANPYDLRYWLTQYQNNYGSGRPITKALIENVGIRPGQGSQTEFIKHCGIIEGLLVGLLIPYERVTPQKWKKVMIPTDLKPNKGASGVQVKECSRQAALRHFPGFDFLKRKKDHGRAEAALIALYCIRGLTTK